MLWGILGQSVCLVYQNCVNSPPVRGLQSIDISPKTCNLCKMQLIESPVPKYNTMVDMPCNLYSFTDYERL